MQDVLDTRDPLRRIGGADVGDLENEARATVDGFSGALHGLGYVPTDLVGTTHVRRAVRDVDRVTLDGLARRTPALARVPRPARTGTAAQT